MLICHFVLTWLILALIFTSSIVLFLSFVIGICYDVLLLSSPIIPKYKSTICLGCLAGSAFIIFSNKITQASLFRYLCEATLELLVFCLYFLPFWIWAPMNFFISVPLGITNLYGYFLPQVCTMDLLYMTQKNQMWRLSLLHADFLCFFFLALFFFNTPKNRCLIIFVFVRELDDS